MRPQRIAIDMDEVLADTLTAQLVWLRERFGLALTRSDLHGKRLDQVLPARELEAHHAVLHEGGFFAELPVMAGAAEVVRALAGRYELFVASAATEFPGSFRPKFDWLTRHFPVVPASHVVFCGDKGILDADYLIDDNPEQLRRFRGQGLLFDAPHNAHEARFPRLASWEDVARRLLSP